MLAALLLVQHPAAQGFALTAMELLDQYEHGNPLAPAAFGGVIHIESVKDALHSGGEAWIAEAGPRDVPRRRLVAAAFALETARAGLDYEWANSVELIDWGWSQLNKQDPPLPAERLWHLAAIALFEGAFDEQQLEPRLRRIKNRFPKEPRILLADAWLLESLKGAGFPPPSRGKPGGVGDTGSNIIGAYTKALASPDATVAGEADLRLGYYDLIADRSESALTRLAHTESTTTDPDVLYLVHLFRGWTLARMDREAESTAEYQRAVDAVPAASTGALWLARRLLIEGKRAQADAVTDRSLVGSREIDDPWRLYGYGDFHRFPALIKQLREAIR
ncbi:MAG TPA: hypothetical protein VLT86_01815 [Vicinamibacterales bacterium]|nr:hypothetical protein [Vicinamibacterales bacterium]